MYWLGEKLAYFSLSVVFGFLLLAGVVLRRNIGYLLLAVLLWIAYWLKLTLHLVDPKNTWIEPTGYFDFSGHSWDTVASVAMVGGIGVMLAGIAWQKIFYAERRPVDIQAQAVVYTRRRRYLVLSLILAITCLIVFLNEDYGIFHAGLRPAVDLPWPLQGIWGWLISIGITLLMMVAYHLEVISGRPLWTISIIFLSVCSALSITSNSRGSYVLQAMPLLVTLYVYRDTIEWLNYRRLVLIAIIFLAGALVTVAASQYRRAESLPSYKDYSLVHDFPHLMQRLSIDRWVGLEGVMAVTGYPERSMAFFLGAAKERRDKDHVDTYTAKVSLNGTYDIKKYHFATIPGAVAFLYYSGSLWVVLIGAFLLSTIVLASEHIIGLISRNPFLSAQIGAYSAIVMIQMGGGGLSQPASVLLFSAAVAAALGGLTRRALMVRSSK